MNFSLYIQIMSLYTYLSKTNLKHMRSYELRRIMRQNVHGQRYSEDHMLHVLKYMIIFYIKQFFFILCTVTSMHIIYMYNCVSVSTTFIWVWFKKIAKNSYFENSQYFSNFSTIFHHKIKRNMCSYYYRP